MQVEQRAVTRSNRHYRHSGAAVAASGRTDRGPVSQYVPFGEDPIAIRCTDERMTRFRPIDFHLHVDSTLANLTCQLIDVHSVAVNSWLRSYVSVKALEDVRCRVDQNEIREQFSRILFSEGDHKIADVLFNNFAVQ